MEDMDLKQERRYCSRIGAALFFVLIWTSAWQYGIIALDVYILPVRMPDTLYYALILVGGYAVSLPAAFRICKGMPPMPFCKELPRARTFVRWAVIGFALMWIGSLIGNAVTDLVGLVTGRAPAPIVDDMVNAMPLAVNIVCVCLLGPLCEELLFRGLVAGRLARYGQAPGALFPPCCLRCTTPIWSSFSMRSCSVCCSPMCTTAQVCCAFRSRCTWY